MGGRGGSSGLSGAKETAFSVTMNGETTEYKFTKKANRIIISAASVVISKKRH